MEKKYEEIAKRLGVSVEQVKAIAAAKDKGTWTTTASSIITHEDGTRHWSSQACEQCW
jgi:hypothetical protein